MNQAKQLSWIPDIYYVKYTKDAVANTYLLRCKNPITKIMKQMRRAIPRISSTVTPENRVNYVWQLSDKTKSNIPSEWPILGLLKSEFLKNIVYLWADIWVKLCSFPKLLLKWRTQKYIIKTNHYGIVLHIRKDVLKKYKAVWFPNKIERNRYSFHKIIVLTLPQIHFFRVT